MSLRRMNDYSASYESLHRAMIFLFFVAGSLLSKSFFSTLYQGEDEPLLQILFWIFPLCAALVLSSSVLGTALLPLGAMAYGGICGANAEQLVLAYYTGVEGDIKNIVLLMAVVPVFFLVAVKGMGTAELLNTMLDNSSQPNKAAYNREYIPLMITVTVTVLAIYLIGG